MKNVFLFHLKSSFRSPDIQIFVIRSSLFFPPVTHCFGGSLKINLKFDDVITCLNKNLITHFVLYLEKERRYEIETLYIDGVLNKEHFNGKFVQKNVCQKLFPDPFLILVNNPKEPLHLKNSFKNKIF